MDKIDPDAPTEWTYAEQWQSDIEDAHNGNTGASRNLLRTCIRMLRLEKFPVNVRLRDNEMVRVKSRGHGYLPEPFCSFLLETLEKALSVPSKEVGKEMGIGNPPKNGRNDKELYTFMDHYMELMAGADTEEGVTPEQRHAQVLEEIKVQMNTTLRSVQRYWRETEFLFDFEEISECEDNPPDD